MCVVVGGSAAVGGAPLGARAGSVFESLSVCALCVCVFARFKGRPFGGGEFETERDE